MPARLGRSPDNPATRLALTIVLLLAFCAQSLVVGSHVHLERGTSSGFARSAASSISAGVATASTDKRDGPARAAGKDCLICAEAALAGHYLPPPALVLAPATATLAWLATEQRITTAGRQRSHAWHSRGPPA